MSVLAQARFRVVALAPISRQLGPLGDPSSRTVPGVSVRAVPVERVEGEWGTLEGWYANSPASQVGFSVFGEAANLFHVGLVFDMPVIPAQ